MSKSASTSSPSEKGPLVGTLFKGLLTFLYKVVLPIAIILIAVGFYKHQMDTRPEAQRRPAARQARLVTVKPVSRQSRAVIVPAMGTVKPATEIALTAEVTGVVTYMNPAVLPGGLVEQGQVLYRIDSRDYEAIVQQRQSEVARAELALRLEEGNQAVARQEFELLGEMIDEQDRALVLRRPHLAEARAALAAAEAALAKARLDVERCTIRAPFNAIVKARLADVAARISPTTALAVLTGRDVYWVELLVRMDQLRWIQFPDSDPSQGSAVRITNPALWQDDEFRQGRILRLMGQLEEAGRMAQLIVSVPDPLVLQPETQGPRLLIGAYVRAEIEGQVMSDVVVLPRAYLRDGGYVWVMNEDNELEIRDVDIVFRGRQTVYIDKGLLDGERVVSSDLSAPVAGMSLQLEEDVEADMREALQ